MNRLHLRIALVVLCCSCGGGGGSRAQGEVVTDGTLGTSATLSGVFEVPASLGTQAGGNLFHSFSRFNLATGESATFSGPAQTTRVLARVTGGQPSSIDGAIRSSIAGADLFLINPAGIV